MTKIALVGAGGKMGCRLTDNFIKCPQYDLHYLEVNEAGVKKLAARKVEISNQEDAIPIADVVILSVPDVAIKKISKDIIPQMKTGALVITLDPAAPLDGRRSRRDHHFSFPNRPAGRIIRTIAMMTKTTMFEASG